MIRRIVDEFIGDCVKPKHISEAIREGFEPAYSL
jgi:hypothetical protein